MEFSNLSPLHTVKTSDPLLQLSLAEPENGIQFKHADFQNIDFCFDQYSQIHGQKVIFVALDFETTGLDVHVEELTQIAALPLLTSELHSGFTSLIKTKRPYVNNYNKITHDMLAHAPTVEYVLPEFVKWLEKLKDKYGLDKIFILAHNAKFDESCLMVNLGRLKYNIPFKIEFIDTILAGRHVLGTRKNSISALCKYFNIPVGSNQHTAPADIALLTQILKSIFTTAYDDNPHSKFECWISNPHIIDKETWFCRQKIMDKNKISLLSPVVNKIQRAMFGIPNSAKNFNTKNMKIWKLILPASEFTKIKFDSADTMDVLGSNHSLISFHEIVVDYFANLKTCSYLSVSNKSKMSTYIEKCSNDTNLILSNLPYCGYICETCHQLTVGTSQNFDIQKFAHLLKKNKKLN